MSARRNMGSFGSRTATRLGAGLILAVVLAACGSDSSGTSGSSDTTDADAAASEQTTVTVLAAASLTEAFTSLAEDYEAEHDGVTIALSFGSSTTLAQQIAEGAEADIYASAGRGALDHLPENYAADGGEELIAHNVLEIAVPPGNPAGITGLTDFARADIDTVLCTETVPCGRAADEAFTKAGITPTPASREIDVKATLAKVALEEADAAIVYKSDVVTAGEIEGVEIPDAENVVMDYPLIWFNTDPHTTGFAEFVAGEQGRQALTDAGFTLP